MKHLPTITQVVGAALAIVGMLMLFGLGPTLLIAGASVLAIGILAERGASDGPGKNPHADQAGSD